MKQFLAVFFAASMGCLAVVVGVWSGDRTSPTESISSRIEPPLIAAGGAGEVHYRFQRFRACDRRVMASIIDSTGKRFEYSPTISPPSATRVPGKADTYVKPFRVQRAASAGPAVYHVEIEDRCNPLHTIWPIRRTIEVPFEIGPPEPVVGGASYRASMGLARCFIGRFAGLK